MDPTVPSPESFLALCQRRKSLRAFSPRPVEAEKLEYIKTVAATSPFASGKKNWGLRVVTARETMDAMAQAVELRCQELALGMREDLKPGFLRYAANFRIFGSAPAVVVPTFRVQPALSLMCGGDPALAAFERENYLKSISCVALLALLAAEAQGLGACYMTGPLLAQEQLARILGLNPAHEIGALIPVGYENDGRSENP